MATHVGGAALAATLLAGGLAPNASAYDFRKSITIDRTTISDASCGTTLTSFPMLFSVTDPDLAHTTSAGDVTDLGGDDVIFVGLDAATCGGPSSCILAHEIERYVNTTGELVAWVRIPYVNTNAATSNTVIYVQYGDSTVTAPTENSTGVWDASYKSVWHLEEDVNDEATGGVHDDSTSNGNDGSQRGNAELAGQIADGQDFDGLNDRITISNPGLVNAVTVSAWVKHDTLPGSIQDYIELGNDVFIRHDGINGVGQLDFAIRSGGTSYHFRNDGALTTGDWYHVAGTWDGTTQRLFKNGVEVLPALTPGISLAPLGGQFTISNPTEPMDGLIDEARVSDVARSACWIDAEYDNQLTPGDVGAPGFYTLGAAEAASWNPPTFTTPVTGDGRILWDGGPDDQGYGVVVQDDGKILVAGFSQQASYDFTLWRYNADGTPDVSFGGGDGIVFTDFSGVTDIALAVAIQADGKIVAAGRSDGDFAVARYNGDGSLDTSFDTDGRVTTDLFGDVDLCQDVAIQPDGKIVLSGYAENGPGGGRDWALVRYNTDGSLDLPFGGSGTGIATADFSGGGGDTGQSVLLQPDGKIVMGGRGPTLVPGGPNGVFTVARFDADGTLDTSFAGGSGYVSADIGLAQDIAFGIALQSDGKIVEAGYNNGNKLFAVVRWNSDGTPDATFDGDGMVTTDIGAAIGGLGRSVTVQPDGKLLVTGVADEGFPDRDFAAVRYNTDGSLDLSFGGGDGIVIDSVGALDDSPFASTVQPDGKITIVGRAAGTGNDLQILRYDRNGTLLDTEFDGTTTLDGAPTFIEGAPGVVLDADVDVRDVELDALNGGSGDYDGADLVLERVGGPNAEDVFDFVDGNGITRIGTALLKGGSVIATFIDLVPGRLTMSFVHLAQTPTSADVDNILRQITYANSSASPPASVQIQWAFNDDVNLETTGATTVAITGRYDFRKRVTIDRGQIADVSCGVTLTNFPMLFNSVDPDLRHTTFGGDVTDLGGDDIIFQAFDTTTCGGPTFCTLDHEIERYDNTTGELVAWVRLPSVNAAAAASDTVVFLTYGNNQVTAPTENPTGVWNVNYQGVWHLDEGDSTAANFYQDSTANSEHGTLTDANGNSTAAAGQIGGGYDFNGDADRIDIPNFSQYLTTAMTISGWVSPPAPHANHDGYFGIRNGDADHSFYALQLANTNDLEFRFRNSVGGVHDVGAVSAVSVGTWVYVALTYDGTNLISYVDGQLANQDPTATGSFSSAAHTFSIGAVGGNPLDGIVDEVRASNTARTACWVGAEYNNQAWPDKAVTPSPDPSPNPSEGFYGLGPTTAVELVSFTARGVDGAVELFWETGSELDNLGFHLDRATSVDGPWERVTPTLIPGLGSSPAGARYRYVDTSVTNDVTYYYVLEDVETTGATERHGPVWATPASGLGEGSNNAPSSEDEGDVPARITYGDPEANAFRVRPHRNGVMLELTTRGFVAVAQQDGSVRLEVPGLEEFLGSSLPVKRTWLEALAGKDVKVASRRAYEVERFAGLRPSASLEQDVEATSSGTVRARLRRRGRRLLQREGAKLVEVGYQGEAKKALVELSPFAWDGSGLVVAQRLEVYVAFRGREAQRPRANSGNASVRLVAKERGLYGVELKELLGARRASKVRKLRLSRRGKDLAYHLQAGTLYFWSEGASANPYGHEAVYELEVGIVGERMEIANASSATSTYYMETLELEENRYYQSTLLDAPDLWLWEVLFAPERKSFDFDVSALSAEPVSSSLDVWIQGTSDFPAVEDHHVRIYVNGSYVGEGRWDGKTSHRIQAELSVGILREGVNTLELESLTDTGAEYSMVMVDRFRIRYPRSMTVLEHALHVIELTDSSPRWVASRAGFDARGNYVAVNEVHQPERRSVARSRLTKKRRADYLVIGPEALVAAAKPLLRHRKRQGLRTATATTEAIASEFGHGELTPEAIHEFIGYAYHEWRAPRLRYVLLLGDATYDFKNYLGTGVTNQVPPFIVRTSYLWTASDPAYAAVNGDDSLPDVAIGRLPAKTPEELRAMVTKILAYENGELAEEAPFVLVADNADQAGNFEKDADELASTLLAGHETTQIYLSQLGTSAAREAIVESFDRGASTVSYLGHGAINFWADENLFNNARVATLSPQSQQPVLLTMNCLNGYFHFPYFDSLAETLVKQRDKGAIAAFSPSGLSLNAPAHRYHQALLQQLLSTDHTRLGDAVLAAQKQYADTGVFPELLSIYHLFGDPALTLR